LIISYPKAGIYFNGALVGTEQQIPSSSGTKPAPKKKKKKVISRNKFDKLAIKVLREKNQEPGTTVRISQLAPLEKERSDS